MSIKKGLYQGVFLSEEPALVQKRKIPGKQTVELSVELAPYIQAYKNYKHIVDMQKGSKSVSEEQLACKIKYEHLRTGLFDGLTALTGGCWEDVFDLAMPPEKMTMKNSVAYQVLEDSFVEILNNTVDETIAKHMESSRSIRPLNTLKAILTVSIDDTTHRDNISITCVDNGRGYKKDFLEKVDSAEGKKQYADEKSGSNKRSSNARSISPDIDIFTGGRGLGLRMLIRKVDEGAPSESARRYIENVQRPKTADIVFNNKLDSTGRAIGAEITITTSKPQVNALNTEPESHKRKLPPIQTHPSSLEIKQQLNVLRKSSPLSINTDFSDEEDNSPTYWGPGS